MNKNRGIWIVIGSILVIGILVTFATASFVKSKENVPDSAQNSGLSNAEVLDASEEANGYGEAPELFSADLAAPKEAPEAEGKVKSGKADPAATESEASSTENRPLAADSGAEMKSAANSAPASGDPETALKSSEESAVTEPVITPISPDTRYRLSNAADPTEGAAYYQKHLADLDTQIKKMREESGDSNTYSMKALADKELKLWNREQNVIYTAVSESLDDEARKELELSQQAWIKSRDAKAEEAAKKYSGGSLEGLEYTASLAESTRARAYDLLAEYTEVFSSGEGQ